jgi:hypothetical protein
MAGKLFLSALVFFWAFLFEQSTLDEVAPSPKADLTSAQQQSPSQGPRQAFSFADGNKVLQFCESSDPSDGMWCAGYISAAAAVVQSDFLKDNGMRICLPSNVNVKQLSDMVVKFLKEHPEKRHYDAFGQVFAALLPFACSLNAK